MGEPPAGTEGFNVQIQMEMDDPRKSLLEKYRTLVVGRPGLLPLILYELVTTLTSGVPGAIGILLRKAGYGLILGGAGKGAVLGTGIVVRHPHKVRIGNGVVVDDVCLLDAKGNANRGITIGSHAFVGRGAVLSCKDGDIELGEYANIGVYCNISSNSRIRIGSKVLIGPHCSLFATAHNIDRADRSVLEQGWTAQGIEIGDGAWLGAGVTVLDGCNIGPGAVVGAGAVVTKSIPAMAVAAGVPARVIRMRGKEEA